MSKPTPNEETPRGRTEDTKDQEVRWGSGEQVGLGELVRKHSTETLPPATQPLIEAPDDGTVHHGLAAIGTHQGKPKASEVVEPSEVVWPRLKAELQDFQAWEEEAWCGVDEHLLARYLAGECTDEERQHVEQAAEKSEYVRDCLQLVEEVLAEEAASA